MTTNPCISNIWVVGPDSACSINVSLYSFTLHFLYLQHVERYEVHSIRYPDFNELMKYDYVNSLSSCKVPVIIQRGCAALSRCEGNAPVQDCLHHRCLHK
jgi:hypothetical protein